MNLFHFFVDLPKGSVMVLNRGWLKVKFDALMERLGCLHEHAFWQLNAVDRKV